MLGPTEKNGDFIMSGILFCIGLFSVIASQMMPPAGHGEVGPGFFPTIIGVLLCGISIALGIQTLIKRDTINRLELSHKKVWSIAAAIILLGIFFKSVGFILTVSLFVAFLLKLFSTMGYKMCLALGVAAATSAYLIFSSLIGLQLPGEGLVMNLLRWSGMY